MILLIDNYDSFSYNLYQYIGSIYPEIRVVRNDALTLKEIRQMKPEVSFIAEEKCSNVFSPITNPIRNSLSSIRSAPFWYPHAISYIR